MWQVTRRGLRGIFEMTALTSCVQSDSFCSGYLGGTFPSHGMCIREESRAAYTPPPGRTILLWSTDYAAIGDVRTRPHGPSSNRYQLS